MFLYCKVRIFAKNYVMHSNPLDGFFKMIQYGCIIIIALFAIMGTYELGQILVPRKTFYTKTQPIVRYEVDTTNKKDTTWITYLRR